MPFAAWGRFVHRHRWPVLIVSALLLGLSVLGLRYGGDLKSGGPTGSNLDAARAQRLINSQATTRTAPGDDGANFLVILSSPTLRSGDPEFRSAATDALARLRADARVRSVFTPYDAPAPELAAGLVSRNGHAILASVHTADPLSRAVKYEDALRREVSSPTLKIAFTGLLPINRAFNDTLEADLQRAETISLPVSLLLLLLIFGAVVAAALPLAVGVLAIVGGLGATLFLARFTDVSQYALNIVTLIGLGVAIDYSLFVVNRYRDELAAGAEREAALATTLATAGRAITFSGVTVAIGLSAMLFYQGTFLASMGLAGAIVVFVAVLYGLTFLPALLAVLGPNVDRLSLGHLVPQRARGAEVWRTLAAAVMRRPVLVLVPTVALLVACGLPFLHLRLANGDVDQLPPRIEARAAYDRLLTDFPGQDQNTLIAVVDFGSGDPATAEHRAAVEALAGRLAALPNVTAVQPPVSGTRIATVQVATNQKASSDGARALLKRIRAEAVPGATLLVTGETAFDVDVITYIERQTPGAVAFVMVVTYLVLFLLTGSLVLPLKALAMNLLSIAASFGALVFLFQDGHLAGQLNFTAQSIDPTVPVILFSIVFGLSMDYEVLLVSRIHEEYLRTGDNRLAVAEGLQRSGRLITGAAAIMVAVFLAFGMAEVVVIKAIGLGLAIAVAIDATIVRALVVPAIMRLLGDANWWAPRPLRRLYRRAGLGELEPAAPARAAA